MDQSEHGRSCNLLPRPDHRAMARHAGPWTADHFAPPAVVSAPTAPPSGNCGLSYSGVCIPPPPPDLDCGDIPFRRFTVLPPNPHRFDGDVDGVGCEG